MKNKNEKNITLDGNKTGFCAKAISNSGNPRWIMSKKECIRLFKNLDIAEATAKSIARQPGTMFEYYICLGSDDKIFPIEDCQKINGHWELFDEGIRYIIKESNIKSITRYGYIVFDEGDSKQLSAEVGHEKSKELLKRVRAIATNILYENGKYPIYKVKKGDHEIIIDVINTAQIHIMSPTRLMDINYIRKSEGVGCIPFNKSMDKYSTLFVYISKDISETDRIGSDEYTNAIFEYIMSDLEYYYKESNPRFVESELYKRITVKEEYLNGKNSQVR